MFSNFVVFLHWFSIFLNKLQQKDKGEFSDFYSFNEISHDIPNLCTKELNIYFFNMHDFTTQENYEPRNIFEFIAQNNREK